MQIIVPSSCSSSSTLAISVLATRLRLSLVFIEDKSVSEITCKTDHHKILGVVAICKYLIHLLFDKDLLPQISSSTALVSAQCSAWLDWIEQIGITLPHTSEDALKHLESSLSQEHPYLVPSARNAMLCDVIVWCTLHQSMRSIDNNKYSKIYKWSRLLQDEFQGIGLAACIPAASTVPSQAPQSSQSDATPSPNSSVATAGSSATWVMPPSPSGWELPPPVGTVLSPCVDGSRRNVLITSALPYVNNVPHLGNIIGCVLSADVYARFCRLRNHNTLYICGTDEYGTATETKALQEGLTPQQICDKYHKIHADVYKWFDIDFDYFGRTTTEAQTSIAQAIFWRLHEENMLRHDRVEQLFCRECNKFLADRFVTGTCPLCNYEDARGDQCDGCGKLLNPIELIKPVCGINKAHTAPEKRSTEHLFLDLPTLTNDLCAWVDKCVASGKWTANSMDITQQWIKGGLNPRCITRDLKWGTPVPLEGFTDKVFYVWFDAPIGYISITANYVDVLNKASGLDVSDKMALWRQWWQNPENIELAQFMGKDNVPFHTVIFPSSLIGTRDKWTLVSRLSTTEYLNYETGKFSKSRGVGVFGDSVQKSGISVDIWRYYLLSCRPESGDSIFNWDDLACKTNGELMANLGNFVNRIIKFCSTSFNGKIPIILPNESDIEMFSKIKELVQSYVNDMEACELRGGLRTVMALSKIGNGYMQETAPWKLIKVDKTRCGSVVGITLNIVYLVAILMDPFTPTLSRRIFSMLSVPPSLLLAGDILNYEFPGKYILPTGHCLASANDLVPLVKMIGADEIEHCRSMYGGATLSSTFPLKLVVGEIMCVVPHPNPLAADKVYMLTVNLGESTGVRTIVSGLRKHYPDSNILVGKQVVVVTNLPSVDLRGVVSQGMILTCERKGKLGLFMPQYIVSVGSLVVPNDDNLNNGVNDSMITKDDFDAAAIDLRLADQNGSVVGFFKKQSLVIRKEDNSQIFLVGDNGVNAVGSKIK